MPVNSTMVRNRQDGPTVYTYGATAKDYIEWGGRGDLNGEDIRQISTEVLEQSQFQQMIKRGVLEIVEDQELIDSADKAQQEHWERRQGRSEDQARNSIENTANNDLLMESCVGPSSRGTGRCGVEVPVREVDRSKRPPLCDRHKDLEPEFIPEQGVDKEGLPATNWTRVTIGERERQQ